ncbi:AfsR/SARP family transcriptional regulator [Streptomyces sp. NRRL B-24484]|uniref:AfsR/SARP family transcriptional regulator n=1 Tax=Streptomyces sp. NRRL B-24484 TaxID=1463833 RepID=UPI00133163F3|nr:BTAD domain-containing putative transcriptional regulator [Streptomyces sp. NRRL B-24484]
MIQALPGGVGIRGVTTARGGQARRSAATDPSPPPPRPRALRAADGPDGHRPCPATGVRIDLLGGFALHLDGEEVQPGIGARRLLALLAVEQGGLTRSRAAAVLWPGLEPARAGAALRTALHRLPGCRADLLHEGRERLRLAPDVTTDLGELRTTATRVLNLALPLDAEELGRAAACDFGNDLLPDWEEDWLDHHRMRWREQRLHTLEALSFRLVQAGWVGAAVDAALIAIHADNLRESAHETLVAAYLAAGNRIAATTYRATYRELLRRELGGREPAARDTGGRPGGPHDGGDKGVRSLRSLHRPATGRHDAP